jgi:hypothetical protein
MEWLAGGGDVGDDAAGERQRLAGHPGLTVN